MVSISEGAASQTQYIMQPTRVLPQSEVPPLIIQSNKPDLLISAWRQAVIGTHFSVLRH